MDVEVSEMMGSAGVDAGEQGGHVPLGRWVRTIDWCAPGTSAATTELSYPSSLSLQELII